MQYILTEEEYKNLVPVSELYMAKEKIEKLNKEVLNLFNGGMCLKEYGGYCDRCPIGEFMGIGTCNEPKSYSK